MTVSSGIQRWRIVVPVHNARRDVVTLLKRLEGLNANFLACLILVDDGSTDGTSEFVSGQYPQVNLIRGDGNLWWGGGMRLGMQFALDQGAEIIFWLNHDCFPVPGAFEKIASVLKNPDVGCVSGWCRINGYPDYAVSPGFSALRPLTIVGDSELVVAEGLNGNFVGFRSDVVMEVGLPDAKAFPHYGDGVYTLRFSRVGYKVLVCTTARADLEFELERRLSPFWRVAVNYGGVRKWMSYYFFSVRSLYHLSNRYRQIRFMRGSWKAPTYSIFLNCYVALQIMAAVLVRKLIGLKRVRKQCIRLYSKAWPLRKLAEELDRLDVSK